MQYLKDIKKALKELETRRTSYMLDMVEQQHPNGVKYNHELIIKLAVTDAQIHTLKWVLKPKPKLK